VKPPDLRNSGGTAASFIMHQSSFETSLHQSSFDAFVHQGSYP